MSKCVHIYFSVTSLCLKDQAYNCLIDDLKDEKDLRQAGAELCQAQHSLSLDLDTTYLGLITQPAMAGARSLAELQLGIYWHKGMVL